MRQRRCDAALHLWIHCIHDGCLSSRFTWPNTPRVKCLTLSADLIIISTGNNWSSITLRDFDRCLVTRGGTGREEFCDISVITLWNLLLSRNVVLTQPHGPFHQHMPFSICQLPLLLILCRLLPKVSIKQLISNCSTSPRLNWLWTSSFINYKLHVPHQL